MQLPHLLRARPRNAAGTLAALPAYACFMLGDASCWPGAAFLHCWLCYCVLSNSRILLCCETFF